MQNGEMGPSSKVCISTVCRPLGSGEKKAEREGIRLPPRPVWKGAPPTKGHEDILGATEMISLTCLRGTHRKTCRRKLRVGERARAIQPGVIMQVGAGAMWMMWWPGKGVASRKEDYQGKRTKCCPEIKQHWKVSVGSGDKTLLKSLVKKWRRKRGHS